MRAWRPLATTQPFPGAFGAGVVGVAQDPNLRPPGLGDGIQAPQAGQVPDEVVPNTCNGLSRSGPNERDPRRGVAAGHDLAFERSFPDETFDLLGELRRPVGD